MIQSCSAQYSNALYQWECSQARTGILARTAVHAPVYLLYIGTLISPIPDIRLHSISHL